MSKYSHDLIGILRGIKLIASASVRTQEEYVKHIWSHSSVRDAFENGVKQTSECSKKLMNNPSQEFQNLNHFLKESAERSSVVVEGLRQYMSSGKSSSPVGAIEVSKDSSTKSYSTIKNIQNLDIASITLKELENLLAEHNKIREVNLKIDDESKKTKKKKKEKILKAEGEEATKIQPSNTVPTPEVVKDEKQVESMMKFITNYDREPSEEKIGKVPVPEVSFSLP